MSILEGLLLALASAVFVGTGIAVLYARAIGKDMRSPIVWAIIAILALIILAGIASLGLSCESDRWRRCDLEPPNPARTDCGLGHEHLC